MAEDANDKSGFELEDALTSDILSDQRVRKKYINIYKTRFTTILVEVCQPERCQWKRLLSRDQSQVNFSYVLRMLNQSDDLLAR